MEPRLLEMWGEPLDPDLLEVVAEHLRGGGLVAMPTETVYGFTSALQEEPLKEIQRLKARGPGKPFLVLIPHAESVPELQWTSQAREFAKVFWPGALTLILNDPDQIFPPGVRSPQGAVAVRVSPHAVARGVVEAYGGPLVSTSANPPGGLPALNAEEALETARALGAGPDLWVLDGGAMPPSEPSTIIDCTGPEPRVTRVGALPVNRLRCVLPDIHGPS